MKAEEHAIIYNNYTMYMAVEDHGNTVSLNCVWIHFLPISIRSCSGRISAQTSELITLIFTELTKLYYTWQIDRL